MPLNKQLLAETMNYILDHPEEHDQSSWWCGSTGCFAGHVVMTTSDEAKAHRYHADPYATSRVIDVEAQLSQPVPDVAAELLGLDDDLANVLFSGDLSRRALREMVAAILREGHALDPDDLREIGINAETVVVDYEDSDDDDDVSTIKRIVWPYSPADTAASK